MGFLYMVSETKCIPKTDSLEIEKLISDCTFEQKYFMQHIYA